MYFFYGDIYSQDALLRNSKRTHYQVDPTDFIDALKEEYLKYLKLLERSRKLRKGSVIIADNAKIFADEMEDYLRYVRTSNNYTSHFYDFGDDGMEVSIRK